MLSKIKDKDLIIFLVLLVYLKPFNISLIPVLNLIYSLLKILATIMLLLYIYIKDISLSKSTKWCFVFLTWWTISIFLNHNIKNNIQVLLSIFGILLLFSAMQRKKKGLNVIVKYLCYIAKIYIFLQFITIIVDHPIFATTIISFDKYFLGSDNYSAFILIPLSGFILVNADLNNKRVTIFDFFFLLIAFLCLLIPKSWAGLLSYAAFMCFLLLRKNVLIRKIVTIRNVIFLIVVLLVLIIVFNIQVYFAKILKMIGKVGMNSREIIWPKAIQAFMKRPIVGYGMLTDEQISSYILYGTTHAHNIILEFLLDSGIVGSFFAYMWLKNAVSINKRCLRNNAIQSLYYCIVAYLLCASLDFYIGLIYFWVLIILFDSLKNNVYKRGEFGNKNE